MRTKENVIQSTEYGLIHKLGLSVKRSVSATVCTLSVLAVSALALSSCNMDLYPEDQLSTATYFTSETALREYSNYFYRMLPDPETMYAEEGEHFVAPVPNDEVRGIRDIHSGEAYWKKDAWKNLRKINYLLENAHQCDNAEARTHYTGVAHFFRAWFYFDMLRHFGAVPWYDHVINADDEVSLNRPRDSRDVIITHIISDLDSAIAELPATRTPYEVNSWTALALKSRACLFEGTFRKYHAGTTFNGGSDVYNTVLPWDDLLQQAADASLALMQGGGYSLYRSGSEPYRMLFATLTPYGEEMIWARAYSKDLDIKHNAQAWSVARATGFTKRFADLYLMQDGTRFTDIAGYETVQYSDIFTGRDARMAQTMHAPGYVQIGADKSFAVNLQMSLTGYKYIKYIMESTYNTWGGSVCSMPVMRLAEVYLNYAEAKAELGTLTQSDLDMSVNLLRERAGVAPLSMSDANAHPDASMTSESGFGFSSPVLLSSANKGVLLEIRRERMVETPLEGLHYWDIMRWKEGHLFTLPRLGLYFPGEGKYDLTGDGKANILISATKKSGGIGVTCLVLDQDIFLSDGTSGNMVAYKDMVMQWNEDKDYLYPVPITDRTMTLGKLTQNPGWNDGIEF
ncbi:MAG: RagB/SusD family nutrient uptake outer membrane protein [Paludibacteraceae bacterium]|nr:RagB/SusD family nutrient uptake outer membrane protein [Paludibacteraceae bacterium]